MAITTPTALVLGAGASFEYGLPIGVRLLNFVCQDLETDQYRQPLIELDHTTVEIETFRHRLSISGCLSVDAFLERNPEFLLIGKRAIAASLIPRERRRMLFPPHATGEGWYADVAEKMEIGTDGWNSNHLSIVTFNYDRSFECYFTERIGEEAGKDPPDAFAMFRQIPLVHVHGSLGPFGLDVPDALRYESELTAENVRAAAASLEVVSDASDTLPSFAEAEELLRNARRIYFLGFGYAADNLRRLRIFEHDWAAEASRPYVSGTVSTYDQQHWNGIEPNFHGLWDGGYATGPKDFFRNFAQLD